MKKYLSFFALLFISYPIVAQKELPIGSPAPFFVANDHSGNKIDLQQKLKEGSIVVVFYRGQWCPHCTKQMGKLNDSLKFITDLGASVIAITPENNENIDKTIEKSNAGFTIIYDEGHKIMDAYQVTFQQTKLKKFLHLLIGTNINKASGNEDDALPVPATYIINSEGKIIGKHFDKDYTQRMSVKAMVDILKR